MMTPVVAAILASEDDDDGNEHVEAHQEHEPGAADECERHWERHAECVGQPPRLRLRTH
ncbi:MAG: hypothetical protein JWP20_2900 [Roseomonas sp.]|nr:hypothetical protein [Roseomonas sp.]